MNMYIIGIDGGGTETEVMLFHTRKGIIDIMKGMATNPHSTSFEHSTSTVITLITNILGESNISTQAAISINIGMAGLGREVDQQKWLSLFYQKLAPTQQFNKVKVENDAICALYATTLGKDGIVSICGTGALTFGLHNGRTMRVGGWGHLIGSDPGSGYDVGFQALKSVFDYHDGLAPHSKIVDLILKNEDISTAPQLIETIYVEEKERIASFANYVFIAADVGDEIALQIIGGIVEKIVYHGLHIYHQLQLDVVVDGKIPFVLNGGLYRSALLRNKVVDRLEVEGKFLLYPTTNPPVWGNIVLALIDKGYSTTQIKELVSDYIVR